jgi:hypothetical protein
VNGTRRLRPTGFALGAAIAACAAPGCSLGEGTGSCSGTLDEPTCWVGNYDLKPDFFAAIPTTNTAGTPIAMNALQIRIQHGGDYETFSDGLAILIDDLAEVRGDSTHPSQLGKPLVVSLSAGVTPPGVPIVAQTTPSFVHATLYLDQTCRTQNIALYALDAVSLSPDGSCLPLDGGEPVLSCGSGSPAALDAGPAEGGAVDGGALDGGAPDGGLPDGGSADGAGAATTAAQIGSSTITFNSLFDGDPNEPNAAARLTDATFHFYLADPREICPGGVGPPPPCRGELKGYFHFYFERGTPAQPFP